MSIGSKIFLSALVALLSVSVTFAQRDPFTVLQDLGPGFYGILLPFIFTFAITYALLIKSPLNSNETGRRVSVVIAFVIGLFVTAIGGPELAAFFITLFGGASIIMAGILVVVLLLILVGHSGKVDSKNTIILAAVILIGVVLFLNATGSLVLFEISPQLSNIIFVFLVLIAVAWFLYNAGGESKSSAPSS